MTSGADVPELTAGGVKTPTREATGKSVIFSLAIHRFLNTAHFSLAVRKCLGSLAHPHRYSTILAISVKIAV